MDMVQELQQLREELVREIDEKIERMIEAIQNEEAQQGNPAESVRSHAVRNYETIYPLNVGTGIFKGKRPVGVLFPNNTRTETPTWKNVMEVILKDCCKDPNKEQALLNLRGKIQGRNRVLVGSETGKMRSPVQIADALFVETHYDTETLLRILTTRILNEVGYDYSGIQIAIKAE